MIKFYKQAWEGIKISHGEFAFFRDDDVGLDNPAFLRLLDVCCHKNIELNAAIVPAYIEFLDPHILTAVHDGIIMPFQHGLDHTLRYCNGHKRGEFFATEAAIKALERLDAGYRLIESVLPMRLKGFIPPWHSFPPIEALQRGQYDIISGYGNVVEKIGQIVSAPVNIDIIEDYDTCRLYSLHQIIRCIDEALIRDNFIGILLHHNYMTEDALFVVEKIVDYIRSKGVPIVTLDQVAYGTI